MQTQQPNKKLLFVYGSLKRGFDNHQLLKNATFIAEAYFFVEEKIPQMQKPLKVWTMNNDYFLDAFEAYEKYLKR